MISTLQDFQSKQAFLIASMREKRVAHPILSDLVIPLIFGKECKL
jgi:hypothetical protein